MTSAEIVAEYPDLEEENVREVLACAAAIAQDQIFPIPAGKQCGSSRTRGFHARPSTFCDDRLTDYVEWEAAGKPDGYVWGRNWSLAYPGLEAPDDDPTAALRPIK